jgi:hypothetical protein
VFQRSPQVFGHRRGIWGVRTAVWPILGTDTLNFDVYSIHEVH